MVPARKTQHTHVEKVSQDATVKALNVKNFAQASNNLPSRIQQSFDVPKIWEMAKATSEQTVSGFIEFELIRLAESINVSGNLTDGQIQMIAEHLVRTYPNETIADFKICFARAANGSYGKIWKLDGIEVGVWVRSYLDEKYKVLEEELMKEKDEFRNQVYNNSTSDWLQLWKDAIAKCDEEGGVKTHSRNVHQLSYLRGFTDKEINSEGQSKPKHKPYPKTSASELIARELHFRYIGENYDPRTGKPNENWMPEDQWNELNKL